MVKSCSAVNCTKRCVKGNKVPFYTLPKDINRRFKWLTFLNRKKGALPKTVHICGEHFISGQKSNDKNHPDFVPTISKVYKHKPNVAPKLPLLSSSLQRSMRYRKIIFTRSSNQRRKVSNNNNNNNNNKFYNSKENQKSPANQPSQTNSTSENQAVDELGLEEEELCDQPQDQVMDAERIQNLQDTLNLLTLKLKQSETEIAFYKRTLQSSYRNNRIMKIKIDKQTIMNRKLNRKLTNANEILHDFLVDICYGIKIIIPYPLA